MSITTYGLQHIKKEIQHLPQEQLTELLLRLARYKKENKELLAYLLFEAHDEAAFIEKVKAEAGFMFSQLSALSYHAAKGMRKILRLISKYTKFAGSKEAEIELLINFCDNYLEYADRRTTYKPIRLILTRQIEKIRTLINKLHEDLQFDYAGSYNTLLDNAEKKLSWFKKTDYLL
ncbi:hypothetical protein [Mucilaginibacter sp. SP1R1]|uniref:hypothetical protein n=1 Tax=Mucilaginibacter sp. SP1R1 TaxID=2723091 RepID=UPI001618153C|nr:hypothetical protein [Mucilaginibacter sp. SP1R1]MBB6149176.1 acyl-CoA reductase-like NAD-dependent aldehyde dehydrogenase [Mucilaginibacter sp. SP1R1]